jgi:hypothetical protein
MSAGTGQPGKTAEEDSQEKDNRSRKETTRRPELGRIGQLGRNNGNSRSVQTGRPDRPAWTSHSLDGIVEAGLLGQDSWRRIKSGQPWQERENKT